MPRGQRAVPAPPQPPVRRAPPPPPRAERAERASGPPPRRGRPGRPQRPLEDFVSITGLFQSRSKPGLYVGSVTPEYLPNLENLVADAVEAGTGVVFFLRENEYETGPVFKLTGAVSREESRSPGRRPLRRRPIEDAGEEEDRGEEEVTL